MAGWHVEGVARSDHILVIGVANCHLSLEQVSPVWALTPVVGQALEHRRQVSVLTNSHEVDGVPIELLRPILGHPHVIDLRGGFSRYLRHTELLSRFFACE